MKVIAIAAAALLVVGATLAGERVGTPALLPADVADRVEALRAHGDRFERAIRLIEAEAAKPGWTWEADDATVTLEARQASAGIRG